MARRFAMPPLLLGMCLLLSHAAPAQPTAPGQAARPNIVLIMADDMGFSDIGCYGGEIETPNLDRLAAGGLRFTRFYNTARCCPTRASLMTGLYAHQTGVGLMMRDRGYPGYRGDLNDRCVTIAEVLRQAGYATLMVGKWHVTRHVGYWTGNENLDSRHNWPLQRGFERYYGTIAGGGSYYNPAGLVEGNTPVEQIEDEDYYYTDAISDRGAQYIREHGSDERPLFLYVAYTAPHWPLHAPEEDVARYGGRYDAGWDALRAERHRRMIDMGIVDERWPLSPRDPRAPAWEEAEHHDWHARRMEVYAAQIDRMDQGIGRILEAIREIGEEDNTLVLFLADNGGCAEEIRADWRGLAHPDETRDGRPVRRGNNPEVMPGPEDTHQSYGLAWANASNTPFRMYKHWAHEGGIATPLIAYWPEGIAARGNITDEVGHVIDVMPTCLELAGTPYPESFDGRAILPVEGISLAAVFADGMREGHEALFWEHHGNRAVRAGDWKLVAEANGSWELYNLADDRTEIADLAEQYPERVEELSRLYQAWADRVGVLEWPILSGRRSR